MARLTATGYTELGAVLSIARFTVVDRIDWLTSALGVLSAAEQANLAVIRNIDVRTQHAVGRALVRLLAAELSGRDPRRLVLGASAAGKPLVTNVPDLHVSVAHTIGLVVAAACRSAAVGVDVEPALSTAPDQRRLADRLFNASEATALHDVPDGCVPGWFSSVWTIKEAVGKAVGQGIIPALAGAVVEHNVDGFGLASVWHGPSADSWTLHQLTALEGDEKIAVALPAPNVPLGSVVLVSFKSFADACARDLARGSQPTG